MSKKIRVPLVLFSLAIFLLPLTACVAVPPQNSIMYEDVPYSEYGNVLRELMPSQTVTHQSANLFACLNMSAAVEAFDVQAIPAFQSGIASCWVPQYLATVVIAADRDKTGAEINGWSDLAASGEQIGMTGKGLHLGCILSSISYSLDGEDFSLHSAARVLSPIYFRKNLLLDNYDTPILICFDYQAEALAKAGRNMEIIVPAEGTLSFEKGLLSELKLDLPNSRDKLLDAGFRLLDGTCYEGVYPPPEDYLRAVTLNDYAHFNAEIQDMTKILNREIQHTHRSTPVDGQEHQIIALVYIMVAIIWADAILHRTMQKGVRRPAFVCSVLLVCWVLLRILKYSLPVASVLSRYIWYSYYIFELGIPLVLLWTAFAIDKPEGILGPPKWWFFFAGVNVVLVLFVLTNDLHQLAFSMDISGSDWIDDYSYGPVYFSAISFMFVQVLLSQIIMIQKCRHNSRKYVILLPVALYLILGAYGVAYVLRVPLAFESSLTITVGIFALLYIEACVQIGLVPVNRKYHQFFEQSPQSMQIIRDTGEVALVSAATAPLEIEVWQRLTENIGKPLPVGDNELLFGDRIPGGMVIWREDIHNLNTLNREIEASTERIRMANVLLEQEKTIRGRLAASKAKTALLAALEGKIQRRSEKLSHMLHNMSVGNDQSEYIARAALLVCYIKRRCNLFFMEQNSAMTSANELAVYMDELAELARVAGIKCISKCIISCEMSIRHITLMYDFLYEILEWLQEHSNISLLMQMVEEDGYVVLRGMPSGDMGAFSPNPELLDEIEAAGGKITHEMLYDADGFWLTFPWGGDRDA